MLHSCRRSASFLAFCLLLLLFPGPISVTFAAGPEHIIPNARDQQRIQEIVNEFMAKLTMGHTVAVAVVPKNPLMDYYVVLGIAEDADEEPIRSAFAR